MTLLFRPAPAAPTPTASHPQPLTQAPVGQPLRLVRIGAGHAMTHRLAEMGLTRNVPLTVLQTTGGGPLLVAVRGSRVAIGRKTASLLDVVSAS